MSESNATLALRIAELERNLAKTTFELKTLKEVCFDINKQYQNFKVEHGEPNCTFKHPQNKIVLDNKIMINVKTLKTLEGLMK